jgi:hypothetical protein
MRQLSASFLSAHLDLGRIAVPCRRRALALDARAAFLIVQRTKTH